MRWVQWGKTLPCFGSAIHSCKILICDAFDVQTKDVFLHIGLWNRFVQQSAVTQDYDWHVGNQLDNKEHNAVEFTTPPNLTVFQNMKQLHKKNQHVTRSIYDVIDYICNV